MQIKSGKQTVTLAVTGELTLLEAIRAAGLPFSAPCGGKGTCGKCGVLLRDASGTRVVLACKMQALDDMQVEVSDATAVLDIAQFCEPDLSHRHGVAMDLGTTTLAAELVDLDTGEIVARAGRMNPQSIYGSDVISRVEAVTAGHMEDMQKLIAETLSGLTVELCRKTSIPLKSLESVTLAGNTIMEHIATNLSPETIGRAPYAPLSYFGEKIQLCEDLPQVWFAPCISGYVGGDVVVGAYTQQQRPALLIDLGTNGELILLTDTVIVAAATAAGPVFEGMNVRFGMPALPGAISTVRVDETSGEIVVDVIGDTDEITGICGSGLVDAIATMLALGLIDDTGRLLPGDECTSPFADRLVEFEDTSSFKLLPDAEVYITQKDIRNLQLAKAAIAAGIEIVLDTAGLSLAELSHLSIAGAFGQHIDKRNAAYLGMFPQELLDRTDSIGNSSLRGAREALLSDEARKQMIDLAKQTNYVELSTDARFTSRFIDNMGFE